MAEQDSRIDRPWGADRREVVKRDMRKTLDEILVKLDQTARRYRQ